MSTFDRKRSREAQRQGGENGKEILNRKAIPHSLGDFEDPSEWERECPSPDLGKTFEEVKTSVEDAIRNAIAHLTPGREIRGGDDYFQDVGKCRDAVPVLRYLARELIAGRSCCGLQARRDQCRAASASVQEMLRPGAVKLMRGDRPRPGVNAPGANLGLTVCLAEGSAPVRIGPRRGVGPTASY